MPEVIGATVDSVLDYVASQYATMPEYPWARIPDSCILRMGTGNDKWYAAILDVWPKSLGLEGEEKLFVLNVKCEPALIDGLVGEPGFFRAYHMSKTHWLSVLLDGSVPLERVADLIAISRDLVRG